MAKKAVLNKRVEALEKWVQKNEDTGGAGGILETFVYLLNSNRRLGNDVQQVQGMFNQNRDLMGRFMNENELIEDWNEFVATKEKNVTKEQQTDGEGLGEEDPEEGEASEESKE